MFVYFKKKITSSLLTSACIIEESITLISVGQPNVNQQLTECT